MSSLRRLTSIASHLARPLQPTASSFPSTVQTPKLGSALSTSAPREMSASVKEMVDKAIANNDVVVFSKTWCSVSEQCFNFPACTFTA